MEKEKERKNKWREDRRLGFKGHGNSRRWKISQQGRQRSHSWRVWEREQSRYREAQGGQEEAGQGRRVCDDSAGQVAEKGDERSRFDARPVT